MGHLDDSLELFDAVDNVAELRSSPDLLPAVKVALQKKSQSNFLRLSTLGYNQFLHSWLSMGNWIQPGSRRVISAAKGGQVDHREADQSSRAGTDDKSEDNSLPANTPTARKSSTEIRGERAMEAVKRQDD